MTLWLPPTSFEAYQTNSTTPLNYGTAIAASATPHTKNTTYTELIASTSFDAYAILLHFADSFSTGAATSMLTDIAIGAAASESVIIPNLNTGFAYAGIVGGGQKYWFPLYIPAGSRISATAQALVGSQTVACLVWIFGRPRRPVWAGQTVTAYGVNLATSQGVAVTIGTSAAEGSYAEITSGTTRRHSFLQAGIGGNAAISLQGSNGLLDIGIGSATEQLIVENFPFALNSAEGVSYAQLLPGCHEIPSSTRLAARASKTGTSASNPDVILYGVS